jgi:hypothetical protein
VNSASRLLKKYCRIKLVAGRVIEFWLAERLATLKNEVDNYAGAFYTHGRRKIYQPSWLAVNVQEVKKTTEGIC